MLKLWCSCYFSSVYCVFLRIVHVQYGFWLSPDAVYVFVVMYCTCVERMDGQSMRENYRVICRLRVLSSRTVCYRWQLAPSSGRCVEYVQYCTILRMVMKLYVGKRSMRGVSCFRFTLSVELRVRLCLMNIDV